MRIGICENIENIEKAEKTGFDYIELSVSKIMGLSESDFAQAVEKVKNSKIKCETLNVLFPKNMSLLGDNVDIGGVRSYIADAMKRVSEIGGKVVVFGSGKSRMVPEGFDYNTAWKQLVDVTKMVGEEASKYDITIVIEPLNKNETNIINSVAEGLKLVKEVNHPNVKLLADFFHMRLENEGMDIIKEAGSFMKHTHIANGTGRVYPLSENEDIYGEFFKKLKDIGYEGRLSIEGKTTQFDVDAPKSLALLRKLSEK